MHICVCACICIVVWVRRKKERMILKNYLEYLFYGYTPFGVQNISKKLCAFITSEDVQLLLCLCINGPFGAFKRRICFWLPWQVVNWALLFQEFSWTKNHTPMLFIKAIMLTVYLLFGVLQGLLHFYHLYYHQHQSLYHYHFWFHQHCLLYYYFHYYVYY